MDNQGLFDAIADSAVMLDKTGRVVQWNAGATALFGYAKKEVVGRSINLIYDRNYPFPKLIQESLASQKKWQEDTVFIRKNGMKGHCKTSLCPLPDNAHNKIKALLIHQNITTHQKAFDALKLHYQHIMQHHQKTYRALATAYTLALEQISQLEQSERKLRESEIHFHLLAENATDIISRHTPDGICLYASPATKASTGYHPEEFLGKTIYKLIHHDDLNKFRKFFARRRAEDNNKAIVYRVRKKDGEFRWFESNKRLIIDEDTRAINEIQLASRDITDRVLDKKARLRGQELAHVFRLSTMEEMASGMAHEISQPLAAVVNYTRGCVRHLQGNEYDRSQLHGIMEKAANQAERAGEIVQRLKNFFCKGQLVKTPCKVHNVVRETINLIKHELISSKTKVDFVFDKSIPLILIDKVQIQQVLLNLMQNAIEAMHETHPREKRIHINTKPASAAIIEVTMTDSGPGFSREIVSNAFTPFFTTKAHGRGMGLAICRSIIEAHGGQFSINPGTRGHSWIRFSLPISI